MVLNEERSEIVVRMPVELLAGEYAVSVFLLDEECEQVLDQRVDWLPFQVSYPGPEKGVFKVNPRWLTPSEAGSA